MLTSNAQESIFSGINIGAKIGVSRLVSEFPKDFSGPINEFDDKVGFAVDGELSKYLSDNWEIGIEISYTALNGENHSPSFSAEGFHAVFMQPITEPVEYSNILLGQKFFFRYFSKPLSELNENFSINPFMRAGVGQINYKSKFKYIDAAEDDIIFGKGENNNYLELSTAVYFLGAGFKTNLSANIYMIASINFNIVNYDFLDVVHNYDDVGNRVELFGTYSEFKIGIFYKISNLKAGKGRSKKSSVQEYLPFAR